jgi:AcrR family transcriptional regulator
MADTLRDPIAPRRPERANGRRRYELLLDAAERLMQRDGPEGLTVHALAREAGVPAASVYHFFPGPSAIPIGLAERYMAGFVDTLNRPIDGLGSMPWPEIVATLIGRALDYYLAHPYAQRLLLGSDHSWRIREADLANNSLLAGTAAALLAPHFPAAPPDALRRAAVVATSLTDALFTLSIFEQGWVTEDCAAEAVLVCCAYLSAKLGAADPRSID